MSHELLIDRYALGAELLTYAAQGLTLEQQTSRSGPGNWSILELIVHLADSDQVGTDRMKRVIAEEGPILRAYDQDAWVARLQYQNTPIEDALQLFTLNRRWMTRLLRNLPQEDFGRSGDHNEKGRQTLVHLVTGYTQHLDHHLRHLYAKRSNLRVTLYPRYAID